MHGGAGNQATQQYQQTMTYFRPLWKQLRQKAVHPEMVAGLHMIVQDIRHRNYLHAYGIYMSLAIGAAYSGYTPTAMPLSCYWESLVPVHLHEQKLLAESGAVLSLKVRWIAQTMYMSGWLKRLLVPDGRRFTS